MTETSGMKYRSSCVSPQPPFNLCPVTTAPLTRFALANPFSNVLLHHAKVKAPVKPESRQRLQKLRGSGQRVRVPNRAQRNPRRLQPLIQSVKCAPVFWGNMLLGYPIGVSSLQHAYDWDDITHVADPRRLAPKPEAAPQEVAAPAGGTAGLATLIVAGNKSVIDHHAQQYDEGPHENQLSLKIRSQRMINEVMTL